MGSPMVKMGVVVVGRAVVHTDLSSSILFIAEQAGNEILDAIGEKNEITVKLRVIIIFFVNRIVVYPFENSAVFELDVDIIPASSFGYL